MNDEPDMTMAEAIAIAERKILVIDDLAATMDNCRQPAVARSHRRASAALRMLVDWAKKS